MSLSTVSSDCGCLWPPRMRGRLNHPTGCLCSTPAQRSVEQRPPIWRCSHSGTDEHELVEQQRRSVARLAPAAPALNRDDTLELLASAVFGPQTMPDSRQGPRLRGAPCASSWRRRVPRLTTGGQYGQLPEGVPHHPFGLPVGEEWEAGDSETRPGLSPSGSSTSLRQPEALLAARSSPPRSRRSLLTARCHRAGR